LMAARRGRFPEFTAEPRGGSAETTTQALRVISTIEIVYDGFNFYASTAPT
jgi:hypothetical protein